MNIKQSIKRSIAFLKEDTWQSWIASLLLILVFIKFIFFPLLSFAAGTSLPLVVVESCSMYHEADFDNWWQSNSQFYESKEIIKEEFSSFPLKNGLNKGDIVFVYGRADYEIGDIIIFNAGTQHPLIHRVILKDPLSTKGDHNPDQLNIEKNIENKDIIGRALFRIPFLGWVKLVFFELQRDANERGLCR